MRNSIKKADDFHKTESLLKHINDMNKNEYQIKMKSEEQKQNIQKSSISIQFEVPELFCIFISEDHHLSFAVNLAEVELLLIINENHTRIEYNSYKNEKICFALELVL